LEHRSEGERVDDGCDPLKILASLVDVVTAMAR
jgi:hypothetical protein